MERLKIKCLDFFRIQSVDYFFSMIIIVIFIILLTINMKNNKMDKTFPDPVLIGFVFSDGENCGSFQVTDFDWIRIL